MAAKAAGAGMPPRSCGKTRRTRSAKELAGPYGDLALASERAERQATDDRKASLLCEQLERNELRYVLCMARPDWAPQDVVKALEKLRLLDIRTVRDLRPVLEAGDLNDRLTSLSKPTFSGNTLKELKRLLCEGPAAERSTADRQRDVDQRLDAKVLSLEARLVEAMEKSIDQQLAELRSFLRSYVDQRVEEVVKPERRRRLLDVDSAETRPLASPQSHRSSPSRGGRRPWLAGSPQRRAPAPREASSAVGSAAAPSGGGRGLASAYRPQTWHTGESEEPPWDDEDDDDEDEDDEDDEDGWSADAAESMEDSPSELWSGKEAPGVLGGVLKRELKDTVREAIQDGMAVFQTESSLDDAWMTWLTSKEPVDATKASEEFTECSFKMAKEDGAGRLDVLPAVRLLGADGSRKQAEDVRPGDRLLVGPGSGAAVVQGVRNLDRARRDVVRCSCRAADGMPASFEVAAGQLLQVLRPGGGAPVRLPAADLRRGDRLRTDAPGGGCGEAEVAAVEAQEVRTPALSLQLEGPSAAVRLALGRGPEAAALELCGELAPRSPYDFVKRLSFHCADVVSFLLQAPELESCLWGMRAAGCSANLEVRGLGPAALFVEGRMAAETVQALQRTVLGGKLTLNAKEVIVSRDFERIVLDLVARHLGRDGRWFHGDLSEVELDRPSCLWLQAGELQLRSSPPSSSKGEAAVTVQRAYLRVRPRSADLLGAESEAD